MVKHECDSLARAQQFLIPEQFRHSRRAFAPHRAVPAIRQLARHPLLDTCEGAGGGNAARDRAHHCRDLQSAATAVLEEAPDSSGWN
jgi:hypothetical protein